jgi:hypothetical protein
VKGYGLDEIEAMTTLKQKHLAMRLGHRPSVLWENARGHRSREMTSRVVVGPPEVVTRRSFARIRMAADGRIKVGAIVEIVFRSRGRGYHSMHPLIGDVMSFPQRSADPSGSSFDHGACRR